MKLASFKINGATSWGLIDGTEAVDVGATRLAITKVEPWT